VLAERRLPQNPLEIASIETTSLTAPVSYWTNASWNLGGVVGYNAARWITIVAIARLGGSTLLGEFALATAIVAPFFLFANLQLPGLLATDASRRFSGQAYLLVGAGGGTVAVLLAVLFGLQEGRAIATAVALFATARLIDSMGELLGGNLQRIGQFRPIAIGQVLNGAFTAMATIAVLQFQADAAALAVASIAGSAVALAFIVRYARPADWYDNRKPGVPEHLLDQMHALLKLGLPMGTAAGLIGLGASVPTLFLDQWVDKIELGVFSAISLPVLGIGMVVAAASQVAAPRLATLIDAGDGRSAKRHIAQLIGFGWSIGLIATIGAVAAGGWLLSALYGEGYRSAANVLVILCFAATIRCGYSYVGVVLMVMRKPHVQLYVRVLALLILALGLWLLIPGYGIAGAAWAILIATLVEACAWAAILAFTWRTLDRVPSAGDDR
jgi:O-antigen/teichoic acid export membrane protein